MALAMMEIGEIREIRSFHGKEEVKRRLQELGFVIEIRPAERQSFVRRYL